jgi:hypothetical protein
LATFNLVRADLTLFNHWILVLFVFLTDATLIVSSDIFAQELMLFEEIETPRSDNGSRGSARNNAGDIISQPTFTLIGTARFGDYYSALVSNGNERDIRLDALSGSLRFIPGHPGYQVVEIRSGEVSIKYPAERDCVTSEDLGISCNEANVATLRLTNAEAIISNLTQREAGIGSQLSQDNAGQSIPKNPFAALLEEASNSESSSEETNEFTPRRIKPEDIPPGMRVVSTPFGDRLVEE